MNDVRSAVEAGLGAAIAAGLPHRRDQRGEIPVGRAGTQRSAQVDALGRIEAGEQLSIGGQPGPIAVGAERLRGRRDHADELAAGQHVARRRRGVGPTEGDRFAEGRRQARQDLGARHHARRRPPGGAAHVHVFDEADLGAEAAGPFGEIGEFVVVLAADDDGVDLDRAEGGDRGGDAVEDRRQIARSGQALEAIDAQRVEADGDAIEAGLAQRRRRRGEVHAVGGERALGEIAAGRQA